MIGRFVFTFCILLLDTVFCASAWAADSAPRAKLSANVPGFLFVEGEPIRVYLDLAEGVRTSRVAYTLEDVTTGWRTAGAVDIEKPKDAQPQRLAIPLELPERGLYRLHVESAKGRRFALDQTLALTFAPRPPRADSPWGVFYIPPIWFETEDPQSAWRAAASLQRLGASWTRLNFYAQSMDPVTVGVGGDGKRTVAADFRRWKGYAKALREQGIHIVGTVAQVPRSLSSDPANEQVHGDGGPAYHKVKPADYAVWEQLMERMAREFAGEIDDWEIWNEPENQGVYWRGTYEELMELVRHTAAGLRRGNPRARIGGCGFASTDAGYWVAEILLNQGFAQVVDVVTVHYTDQSAGAIDRWHSLLGRYTPNRPIWNTEEKSVLPLTNLRHGLERTGKFLHVAIGYDDYGPLVNKDYSVRPEGLAFATVAAVLGGAKYERSFETGGVRVDLFREAPERTVAVLEGKGRVELRCAPGTRWDVTNLLGKTRVLVADAAGLLQVETGGAPVLVHGRGELMPEPSGVSPHDGKTPAPTTSEVSTPQKD